MITTSPNDHIPEPLTIAVSFGDAQLDEMANHATTEEAAQVFIDELKRREEAGEIMNAVAMEALSFTGSGYRIAAMFGFLTILDENRSGATTTYATLIKRVAEYVQTLSRAEYVPYMEDGNLDRKWLSYDLDGICKEKQLDVNEQVDYVMRYPRSGNLSRADVAYQLIWELHNS